MWQKIARSGVAGIVLEEDAVFISFDVSEIDGLLKSYDSVWLGHRQNTLGYWYNAHAYAISPKDCFYAVRRVSQKTLSPLMNGCPSKLKNYSNYFYRPELVKQIPRSIRPSTNRKGGKNVSSMFITVGTDETQNVYAIQTIKRKVKGLISLTNLGHEVEWRGGAMVGRGGGAKNKSCSQPCAIFTR